MKLDYIHTKNGLVRNIYSQQRANSRKRGHSYPSYSSLELKEYLYSLPEFHMMYNKWAVSGFEKDLRPSIDRINDYIGYSFENIQLMTWKENNDKAHSDRRNGVNNKISKAVIELDKDGNILNEYYSCREASRQTGIHHYAISQCCKNLSTNAGGKTWKYKFNSKEKCL